MLKQSFLLSVFAAVFTTVQVHAATTFVQWTFNSPSPDSNVNTGTDSAKINLLPSNLTQPTIGRIGGVSGGFNGGNPSSPFYYITAYSSSTNHSSDPAGNTDNSAYDTASYPENGQTNTLASNKTGGIQIKTSTIGYKNITLNFDWLVQSGASRYWEIQYGTNGTTFTDLQQLDASNNTSWQNGKSFGLPSAADNQSTLYINIVSVIIDGVGYTKNTSLATANYSGVNGQVRYDMLSFAGDVAPPPAVPEPASLGLATLATTGILLRRRRSVQP